MTADCESALRKASSIQFRKINDTYEQEQGMA